MTRDQPFGLLLGLSFILSIGRLRPTDGAAKSKKRSLLPMHLRIASYNVHKCIGLDRKHDPVRVLRSICAMDADIIALQEADRRFGARLAALPTELIEANSPYRAVAFHIRPGGLGWHGNALLIRKEFTALSARALTIPTLEPRGAVMADIDTGGAVLRVMGVHLDLSGMWRRRQIRSLLSHMDAAAPYRPNVMMGDFNQWSNRGALSEFAFHRHRLADVPPSFPTRRPVARPSKAQGPGRRPPRTRPGTRRP